MGLIIPEDFPLSQLRNEAERRVVEIFRDQLNDGWLIVPGLSLWAKNRGDYELDVILIHRDFGVADIEVKGHKVEIQEGLWRSAGVVLEPQPLKQASSNAYALRDRLREISPEFAHQHVEFAVAIPNTGAITGVLPPGTHRAQVVTATDLEDAETAIERLMMSRWENQGLTDDLVDAIVHLLRPDAQFKWDPAARAKAARTRLDQVSSDQIKVLETLDANRRVVVTGSVGTGKTRLATAWAGRAAFIRCERTLLTCYNDPLAEALRDRLPEDDEYLVIGAFLRVALRLAGMPELDVPRDADDQFWSYQAVGHIQRNWHLVTDRFDTIIVDEAQDFSPAWIAQDVVPLIVEVQRWPQLVQAAA
jgi:hypothetical protein